MVPPIPTSHREQILKLRNAGHSFRDIREILIREHDATYSIIGIGNCFQKMMKNGGQLESQPKQKYSKDQLEKIKGELQSILESNSYLTGQQQIEQIRQRLGITISMDAVGRYRRLLGWRVLPTDDNKTASKKKPVRVSEGSTSTVGSSAGSNSSTSSYTDEASSLSTTSHPTGLPLSILSITGDVGQPLSISNLNSPLAVGSDRLVVKSEEFLGHSHYIDVVTTGSSNIYPDSINFSTLATPSQQATYERASIEECVKIEPSELSSYQLVNTHQKDTQSMQLHPQRLVASCPRAADSPALPSFSSPEQNIPATISFGPQHVFTSKSFIKYSSFKYQVWAGISTMGATSICIWDAECRVKSSFYCDTILAKFFLPFRTERYSNRPCVLVQNNDTIYRSNETRQFMIENEIECRTWTHGKFSGNSSPIELVWDDINEYVRNEVKPNTLDDLRESICVFWATKMTDSRCRTYLKRCPIYNES